MVQRERPVLYCYIFTHRQYLRCFREKRTVDSTLNFIETLKNIAVTT